MQESVGVLRKAEDRRAFPAVVCTDSLEYRGAVVKSMRHGMNIRMRPFVEFSLVPEFFCPGKMGIIEHIDSFKTVLFIMYYEDLFLLFSKCVGTPRFYGLENDKSALAKISHWLFDVIDIRGRMDESLNGFFKF